MIDSVNEWLEEWASGAADLFGRQLISILMAQNTEIIQLRHEVSHLQDQVMALTQWSIDLNEILGLNHDESTEDTDPRPDEPPAEEETRLTSLTENDYIHHQLAERYHHIVDQLLVGLAERLLPQAADGQDPAGEARLVAKLCRMLFSGLDFDSCRLAEEFAEDGPVPEITRICNEVSRLHDDTADAGGQQWRFEAEPGKLPDLQWQEAWPGCRADAPISFVVAPAYVAQDKIFSYQRVFTSGDNPDDNAVKKQSWQKLRKARNAPGN